MKMKIPRLLLIPLCLTMLVLSTAGFRGCSAEEKRSVAQNVTTGLSIAARAVPPGIETVRALRVAGKIEPATSRKLAEGALEVNSAASRLTQAALEGADAQTLAGQLDTLLDLAQGLQRDGTLHIKNEGTRLVFDLSVIVAKNGLAVALRDLKQEGVAFTLDDDTRARLGELKTAFEQNDRLLRNALAGLPSP